MRQLVKQARQLEDKLAELDDLADEDERARMQALCDAVREAALGPRSKGVLGGSVSGRREFQ